jgi:drug/metabolite transporter (DMT)-like permease
MELHVFGIVLVAALFHAAWNAFVKIDGDRTLFMAVLMTASGIAALCATPFLPLPRLEVWPYIALSVMLHVGYSTCLIFAYRYGDLSHVYPLARGSAPLIVAMASVMVFDEVLSQAAWFAVLLMACGIMSLSLTRNEQNLKDPKAVLFALVTGIFIASYTLTDAAGARLAGNAHSYAAWMLGLEWIPFAAFVLWQRRTRGVQQARSVWRLAVPMGLLSLAAYWAVIWAMTVAPASLVAALRESSIVFALLFGVLFLNERLSLVRLAATFTTIFGAALLKFSRT